MDIEPGLEPEPPSGGLIWDGSQFVPESQVDNGLNVGADPPSASTTSEHPDLGKLFGFSASQLVANRDGRMAGRQRLRFLMRALWRMAAAAPFVVMAAVLALTSYELWPIAISVLASMVALYLVWRGLSFAADALDGEVSIVEGRLEQKEEHEYRSTQYFVFVGELKARIDGGTYGKMPVGLACRAYYAPAASALLSLEPLDAAAPAPSRPFGPKAARSMARGLEAVLLLAAGGALAIVLGIHLFVDAQPATFSTVSGTISGFHEEDGRSTSYYVSLGGYGDYKLRTSPSGFSPALPDLNQKIGTRAYLYLRDQNGEVAAIDVDGLHWTDIFADPQIQERDMKGAGILTQFIGLVLFAPLLIAAAVESAVHWPRRPRTGTKALVTISLDRSDVALFIKGLQALRSAEWARAESATPLGDSLPNRQVLDADHWRAVQQLAEKQGSPDSRLETILGENAIAEAIPPDTVGVKGPVAELWEHHAYHGLVDSFRSSVARYQGEHEVSAKMLPDRSDRIEAALCLAALEATPDERSKLARNLVELAAFQADPATAEVETLRWLGEVEGGAREAVGAGLVLGHDPLHDLQHQSSERGLVTGLGCWIGGALVIFGGVVAVYLWLTIGGEWGGWALLGLAAAITPALGRIVYGAVRSRFGSRAALLLGLPATIAAPAAVLAAGSTQIGKPASIAALVVTAPAIVLLLAWLSLRRSPSRTMRASRD